MVSKRIAHFSPGRALFFSFCITIILGTIALALPWAQKISIPFIDVLFTAASATCVTGLFTVPLDHFTTFGHIILLLLIQIGGLGLITLSIFLISLFMNLGMSSQIMVGQVLELESWTSLKRTLFFTIALTLIVESIGAAIIYWSIGHLFPKPYAYFIALFHSVSSFCNAGISIADIGMNVLCNNAIMLTITGILIFIGGLGFVTWYEVISYLNSLIRKKRYVFSLHSKIILYGSTALISASAVLFWILEHGNLFATCPATHNLLNALFQAISFRSSGFSSVALSEYQLPTIFIIMIIAFIGSSPGSTGSGIKITTFFVYLATIKAAIFGRSRVIIRGRTIATDQVLKCIAIVSLSIVWIAISTICLLITEAGWSFLPLLFEATSAFTNLGMSLGVTNSLSLTGKLLIITSMIIGRVGSLTLIVALRQSTIRAQNQPVHVTYPEERVMLS